MNSTLRTNLQASLILALVILSAGFAYAHTQKSITVQGTSTYPQDVIAVQMALNQYDVITLSGSFNFGQGVFGVDVNTGEITGKPAGSVYVTRPNVVLQADKRKGATIVGGGAPFSSEYFGIWPVISITAPDVTLRGLVMSGSADTGIFFLGSPQTARGKTLTIEANTISSDWGAVYLLYTGGLRVVVNRNRLSVSSVIQGFLTPLFAGWTGYTRDANKQNVPAKGSLEITNNEISALDPKVNDVIEIYGWGVGNVGGSQLPPDWGDNGPITISRNTITMDCLDSCTAIQLGRSAMGVNHAQVVNNTIKGASLAGIDKWPYGHDNLIAWNDLTELTTLYEQIGVWARGTTAAYNVLGPVINPPALWMTSINWHPDPDPLGTPMPLPTEYCLIFGNDYRQTGVPGGSMFTAAILINSEADLQLYTGVGTEVRYNFIAEIGKFPDGTEPNEQVYQLIVGDKPLVHDNWILGLSATDGVAAANTQSLDKPFRPMAQERVRRLQNHPWKGQLGAGKPIGPRF